MLLIVTLTMRPTRLTVLDLFTHLALLIMPMCCIQTLQDRVEGGSPVCRWHAVQLLADVFMALGLILFHSTVLICQFMTFSVAINSKRSNALIALLIASNFVEIKGRCS